MRRIALATAAAGLVALGFVPSVSAADTREVAIIGFSYKTGTCANVTGSRDLTVTVSDAVRWTNCDSATHTVTSDTGAFDSDTATPSGLGQGGMYAHKFSSPGDFPYHCRIHGTGMNGTIHVVTPAPPSSNPTTTKPTTTTTTVKPATTTTAAPTTTSTSTTQTTLDLSGVFDDSSSTTSSSSSTTSTTAPSTKSKSNSSKGLIIGLLVLAIVGVGAGAYAVWRRMQQTV